MSEICSEIPFYFEFLKQFFVKRDTLQQVPCQLNVVAYIKFKSPEVFANIKMMQTTLFFDWFTIKLLLR